MNRSDSLVTRLFATELLFEQISVPPKHSISYNDSKKNSNRKSNNNCNNNQRMGTTIRGPACLLVLNYESSFPTKSIVSQK